MERNTKAPPAPGSQRAATWLRECYPHLTRRQIEEALEHGLALDRAGRAVKKGDRVAAKDGLDCTKLDAHLGAIRRGTEMEIPVLLEHQSYAVIDKPAGVKSHPLSLFDVDTVTHWAFARYPEMATKFQEALPTVVPHRLDTGTSGCLIVARDAAEYARWRERFQAKEVRKTYQAWCWGTPSSTEMQVQGWMVHDPSDRRKMILRRQETLEEEGPQLRSESEIRLLEQRGKMFRAEIECRTGVTHQVRVHLASLGFPLVGDRLYDRESEKRAWRPTHHQLRASRLQWEGGTIDAPMKSFLAGDAT